MLHYTTLEKIRQKSPCTDGWKRLIKGLGYTNGNCNLQHKVTLADIALINNAADAFWCIRAFELNDDFKLKIEQVLNLLISRIENDYIYYHAHSAAAAVAVAVTAAANANAAAAANAAINAASKAAHAAAVATNVAKAAHAHAAADECEFQRQNIIRIFGNV